MASSIQLNSTNNSEMKIEYQGTSGVPKTVVVPDRSFTVAGTDEVIGVNQAWQAAELTNTDAVFTDGTPKYRALNTSYTNNTGKPIVAAISLTVNSTTGYFRVKINGTTMFTSTQGQNGYFVNADVVIPNGSSYLIEPVNAVLTGSYWAELR